MSRIISGSANMLVDSLENAAPEMVMEQAIREVDGAIDEVKAELGKQIARKHLAESRLMEENRQHEELAEKIEVAIKEDRDDLAEAAVSRQLDLEAQIPILEHTISECCEEQKQLEAYIEALQAKRREMKEDLQAYRKSQQEASAPGASGGGTSDVETQVNRAGSAFERIMERHSGLIAGSQPERDVAAKIAELEKLTRKNRIHERLQAAKARLGD
ncbi:MAG: PspA/IM30 family protein [Opitutales bacterium]